MKRILVVLLLLSGSGMLLAQEKRGLKVVDTTGNPSPSGVSRQSLLDRKGKDYALLFAGDQYTEWPVLSNPVTDAHAIAKELADVYDFTTEIVENSPLEQIILKLQEYNSKKYSEDDQLFVFFAGHGYFDDLTSQGYLVTKDSKLPKNDPAKTSMLLHSYIREVVDNIHCKHILLMMDVCFGGTIDRSIASRGAEETEMLPAEFVHDKLQYRTRLYITSADKKYVSDGAPGHHSPFADKFLRGLRTFGGKEGFVDVHKIMTEMFTLKPQPVLGRLSINDEAGSDFFFVRKGKRQIAMLTVRTNVPTATIYVDSTLVGTGGFDGEIALGNRTLRVENDGYRGWVKTLNVTEDVGALDVALEKASGQLSVKTVPDDAEIFVDGGLVGKGSYQGAHPFGERTIKITKKGFKDAQRTVRVGDQFADVVITLEGIKAPFKLATVPGGALVEIDGQNRGNTPTTIAQLEYGKHRVHLTRADYLAQDFDVEVSSESPMSKTVVLREAPDFRARNIFASQLGTKRFWEWTTTGLTVAAAGTGLFFYSQANNSYSAYHSATSPAKINSSWDDYRRQNMYRNIAFGAAGAFAIWSVYHWITGPDYDEILRNVKKEYSTLFIMPTEDGVQLAIVVRF